MRRNAQISPWRPIIKGSLALTISLFLGGCVTLQEGTVSTLLKDLGKDPASACLRVEALLYGEVLACRSNEPGSKIIVKANGDLEIWHGAFKIPVEEKELKELRKRIELYESWPKAWIVLPELEPEGEM